MNAFSNVGKIAGIIVALFDMGKGTLVAWFTARFSDYHPFIGLLAVVFAIIGHNWMIFIGFKVGKGIATLIGALFFCRLFLYSGCICCLFLPQ